MIERLDGIKADIRAGIANLSRLVPKAPPFDPDVRRMNRNIAMRIVGTALGVGALEIVTAGCAVGTPSFREEIDETTHYLGLDGTIFSVAEMQVLYPKKESNVDFQPIKGTERTYHDSEYLGVNENDLTHRNTGITVQRYSKRDGQKAIMLVIRSTFGSPLQEVLLRDASNTPADIDNRVVTFRDERGAEKYASLRKNESNAISFQVVLMQKVVKK